MERFEYLDCFYSPNTPFGVFLFDIALVEEMVIKVLSPRGLDTKIYDVLDKDRFRSLYKELVNMGKNFDPTVYDRDLKIDSFLSD